MRTPAGRLRIGFVSIDDASSVLSWSGTPYQILSHLRREPVQVHIFSPLSRRLKYLLGPSLLWAKLRGRSYLINHSPLLLRSYARQIERLLHKHPVDIVFSCNSMPITHLRCRQPIVFWDDSVFHDLVGYYQGFFSRFSPGTVERGRRKALSDLQICDAAVYSSRWAANTAVALIGPAKVHVIPFGSSLPVASSAEDIAQNALQKRHNRPNQCELLWVGVDWERKGGDLAIETARLLNQSGIRTRLRIVGCRPPASPPEFVELLGFVNKATPVGLARLQELYRSADVFVLPTLAEAAGIVFCEASSFGLPSVAFDTGGVGDYVLDGINGALIPLDGTADNFANAVRGIISDVDTYRRLSVRAFEEYRDRLNWTASVKKLVALFESLVSERGSE